LKIRKVSADFLDQRPDTKRRGLSPREFRRVALENELEVAIRAAAADANAAFRVDLEATEKAPTIRFAFNRVRERTGVAGVNLFTREGVLIVANRPQMRGRRRAS
jgi:hypothetical protein